MLQGEEGQPEVLSVSVKEAVRMTGLGRSFLYELMKAGTLNFTNVGKRRLIPVTDLRRLVLGE